MLSSPTLSTALWRLLTPSFLYIEDTWFRTVLELIQGLGDLLVGHVGAEMAENELLPRRQKANQAFPFGRPSGHYLVERTRQPLDKRGVWECPQQGLGTALLVVGSLQITAHGGGQRRSRA